MPRNKANKKSGWKKKDKKYRLEQNAKAKANREKRAAALNPTPEVAEEEVETTS